MGWGSRDVIGGEEGFAVFAPDSGTSDRFCTEAPATRFAWTISGNLLYYGRGAHLMRTRIPEPAPQR
jgi:hypothetical protein